MAFEQSKLVKSNNQRRRIFDSFIYRTSDLLTEIMVTGYFAQARYLRDDDSGWKGGILSVITDLAYSVFRISEDGLSLTRVNVDVDDFNGGFFDYNDLATQSTPLAILSGVPTDIPNDELGPQTNKLFAPDSVADVWNAGTGRFDWSELNLGDMVDIRIDFTLTTTSNNTEIHIELLLGTGGSAYALPFIPEVNFKNQDAHGLTQYNGIYMGDLNTLDNGGRLQITADKDCTMVVNGWYCKVIKRG